MASVSAGSADAAGIAAPATAAAPAVAGRPRVALALQGGGSFGAFTWGVLDRLLEDGRVEIADISGTSAGAVTGAALAAGLDEGGPEAGRSAMRRVWEAVGREGAVAALLTQDPLMRFLGERNLNRHATWPALEWARRSVTPREGGPNPVLSIAEQQIDTARLREPDRVREVFLGATDAETGQPEIFSGERITARAIAAAACLPSLFPAVEIEGRRYWDGGYSVNPPLNPLTRPGGADDILIVQLNPPRRNLPRDAAEIGARETELTFNAPLQRDVRAIERMNALLAHFGTDQAETQDGPVRKVRLHRITMPAHLLDLNATAKLNAAPEFLHSLFQAGRAAADRWLEEKLDQVGVSSTYVSAEDRLEDAPAAVPAAPPPPAAALSAESSRGRTPGGMSPRRR